jgi:hypothetical protein
LIDDVHAAAGHLVETYAGKRLAAADEPAGLRESTSALTAAALSMDAFERLIRGRLEQLRHPSSRAIPDAYLADEAAVEDALQRAAAGIRTAMAKAGHLVDALSFERSALLRLYDDSRLAVRAELARVPRPSTRPGALDWSVTPAPWATDPRDDSSWPPPGADVTVGLRSLPGSCAALAHVEHGLHAGWTQIGFIESHSTPPRPYPDRAGRHVFVASALETADGEPPEGSLPFTALPWRLWTMLPHQIDESMNAERAAAILSSGDQALVGLREERVRVAGLGEPPFLLIPAFALVVALGLVPTPGIGGFSLGDRDGPGLVGRLWRSDLVHDGGYQPAFPAVDGADLLLRPDLFQRLQRITGDSRARVGVSVSYHSDDDIDDSSEEQVAVVE